MPRRWQRAAARSRRARHAWRPSACHASAATAVRRCPATKRRTSPAPPHAGGRCPAATTVAASPAMCWRRPWPQRQQPHQDLTPRQLRQWRRPCRVLRPPVRPASAPAASSDLAVSTPAPRAATLGHARRARRRAASRATAARRRCLSNATSSSGFSTRPAALAPLQPLRRARCRAASPATARCPAASIPAARRATRVRARARTRAWRR